MPVSAGGFSPALIPIVRAELPPNGSAQASALLSEIRVDCASKRAEVRIEV
jgi:hypothetical protein